MKKTILQIVAALAAVALSTVSVLAAGTDTWVGNTSVNWNTAGNWSTSGGSTPPANGDSLVFGAAGSSGTSLNNDISGLTLGGITFGTTAFTFGGNALTLGSGGINASTLTSGTLTIGNALTLAAGYQSWKIGSGGTLAINGAVTRNTGAAVNFSSSGITSSTLANDATGILGGWATTGNGGGAHAIGDFAANDGSGNIITYSGYTAISSGANSSQTLGAGTVTQNWKTSNANSGSDGNGYATTLLNGGTINSLVMQGDLIIPAGATLTLGDGGLILSGISRWIKGPNGNTSDTAQLTSGLASGELFVDVAEADAAANNWTIWPKIVDNGGTAVKLIKSGPGYVALQRTSSYTGGTFVNAGSVGYNLAAGTLAGNIAVAAGASVIVDNSVNNSSLNVNFTGAGTVTLQNTSTTGLSVNGGGVSQDWSGFTGTFNYNSAHVVNWNPGGTIFDLSHAAFNISSVTASSTLGFNGTGKFGSLSGPSGYIAISALQIGNLNTSTAYGGLLKENAAGSTVTKVGTGSLTLSGTSTYTGASTVENGALIAGAAVGASGSGPFGNASSAIALGDAATISSATALNPQLLIGGAFTMARTVTVGANNNALGNASTTFTLGGSTANSSTFSGAITLNQNLFITQVASGTLNITAAITSGASGTQTVTVNNPGAVNIGTGVIGGGTGTIALTKTGAGTLTLTGTHTYTGATAVSGGTLLVNGSLASGSTVSVSGSGSVLGGSGTVSGATTISSSGALTPRPSAGSATTLTFGGNLALASASANFSLSSSSGGSNDKVNYGSSSTLTLDNTDTITITGDFGYDNRLYALYLHRRHGEHGDDAGAVCQRDVERPDLRRKV